MSSSGELGDLVLCVGDLHVPYRAERTPAAFKPGLQAGKMQHALCTGNVGAKEELDLLKEAAPNYVQARGDFDDTSVPETALISVRGLRIGVIHGHQVVPWGDSEALDMVRRRLGADILVSGHTGEIGITEFEGHYFVNPGSLTGAASPTAPKTVPSFIVLSVTSTKVTAYIYKLERGEVGISQVEFARPGASGGMFTGGAGGAAASEDAEPERKGLAASAAAAGAAGGKKGLDFGSGGMFGGDDDL